MAQNLSIGIESKRDLVINQVPITTKPEVDEVLPKTLLLGVIKCNQPVLWNFNLIPT
jgi:hypothetical protein